MLLLLIIWIIIYYNNIKIYYQSKVGVGILHLKGDAAISKNNNQLIYLIDSF